MSEYKIYAKAIEVYGHNAQLLKLFEELAELQNAICKYEIISLKYPNIDSKNPNPTLSKNGIKILRAKQVFIGKIADEIADVRIMLDQLETLYDCKLQADLRKEFKLKRLENNLEKEEFDIKRCLVYTDEIPDEFFEELFADENEDGLSRRNKDE